MISDIPEKYKDSYYVGQEFIEDPIKIDVSVGSIFSYSALLTDFDFFLNKTKVSVKHTSAGLIVSFNQKISKDLFYSIKNDHRGDRFILASLSKFLPKINQEILSQRYTKGHILARTFSIFDVQKIEITKNDNKEKICLSWPIVIPAFPPSKTLAIQNDEIFVRDWIDAMLAYFDNNFDECVRKIITSVENFFRFKGFKGQKRFFIFSLKKFIGIVKKNIYKRVLSHEVIADNLIFIYKIRCKIMHHKFRLSYKSDWFCNKAITTLSYLYQFFSNNQTMAKFIFSLYQQFMLIDNMYCHAEDLEDIEEGVKSEKEAENNKDNIMETPQDIDEFMFKGLRINDKEKQKILKNKSL